MFPATPISKMKSVETKQCTTILTYKIDTFLDWFNFTKANLYDGLVGHNKMTTTTDCNVLKGC